jgi:hypothetical protein
MPSETSAFEALKTVLTMAPVLQLPDFSKPFIVDCDALGAGFDAVLHQNAGPLAFFSHAIAPHHAKLVAYERELISWSRQCGIGGLISGPGRSWFALITLASNIC